MRFIFKARNQRGEIEKGRVDAVSEELAIKVLSENNLTPISVTKEKEMPKIIRDLQRSWEGAGQKDLMMLFKQLHALISAKVPLMHSLRSLEEQLDNIYLKNIIREIANDIDDGVPFSDSMDKYPEVFSKITVSTIRAGEVSGNLEKAIAYVAHNIDKNYRLAAKVKGALFYPAFVLTAAMIIGFLTITFIVPRLTSVISTMKMTVPWYTQALIYLGDFMQDYWWAVLVVIAAVIAGVMYYIKTEAGKREWDKIQLDIPIFGKLFKYVYLARFSGSLAMLITGGIPIVQALAIVSDVVDNSVYKALILRGADEVKSGGSMSKVFFEDRNVPIIVARMIKVGEDTGKLDDALNSVDEFYQAEVDDMVKNMASLIEPILIVFLGMGVAVLVFAVLLPIYNITSQI
ncbi:type II secretion system F family protein [Patescibacteria group bacterium]